MQWRKSEGFTLLECLVALFMLGGILLLLGGLIRYTTKTEQRLSHYQEREWHIFQLQLEHELAKLTYQEVKNNQILFADQFVIKQQSDKVIKAKGYQPLLTKVKTFKCQEVKGGVTYEVEFTTGIKKVGHWIIE